MPDTSTVEREAEMEGGTAIAPFGPLPNGRKRLCGAWTLHGDRIEGLKPARSPKHLGSNAPTASRKFVRLRCKCWSCSLCGPRKASKYRGQILRAVNRERLTRMLTLTLDVRKLVTGDDLRTFLEHFESHKSTNTACHCSTCTRVQIESIKHIRQCWSKLRVYLHRSKWKAPKYIAILEFQKVTGLAHLHIVIDRYIEWAWAKQAWQAVGGGQHVDIRHVDAHRAAAYLSKYLSKDMLLSAPVGMRRVTTSRSIKLDQKKKSEFQWQVVKAPIDRYYVVLRESAQEVVRNDGELESFSVRE
jgi:hypothetical protein